jgi:tetratricopeptide (TPR) repeat protein
MAWESLALLRWRQGDLSRARDAYEQAIAWAEQSRIAVVGQAHRIYFWPTLESSYIGLVKLNLALGNKHGVWDAAQKALSLALWLKFSVAADSQRRLICLSGCTNKRMSYWLAYDGYTF